MTEHASVDLWLAALIVIFCLALSAFFSAGETAFTGASRARMLSLETAGDRRARLVTRLLGMRERFIGAMLIGNNIVNIGVSAFTTSVLVSLVGDGGVIYATVIMSTLVIVFSEVVPKALGDAHSRGGTSWVTDEGRWELARRKLLQLAACAP